MPPKISISRLGKKVADIFLLSSIYEYFDPWAFGSNALASPRHLSV
jgi:hypothetical protein